MTIDTIDREHPEYTANKGMWRRYRDLYVGGEQLRRRAADYLVRRHKEPGDIYLERLTRVFYQNYIGSIIDWYAATLMHAAPTILLEGGDSAAQSYYSVLSNDCDLKGTCLTEFLRHRFVDALVCGKSYMVVDFPRATGKAQTRAEEDALGQSRAYLTDYSAEEVINWSYDNDGSLEWVTIRTSCLRQVPAAAATWAEETRWIHYDCERYEVFSRAREAGPIELLDEGLHGLSTLRRVPVFQMRVSEGLWLMNKAALLQLEHFNKSNALSWALTMGLFAMPVVYSDRPWAQMVGESYYIQLGQGDRFGWTEPEGKVYQIAADNLVQLKDEVYRVCYLMSQATSGNTQQSGLSKQLDFATTDEVLGAYGAMVRQSMKQVLGAIGAARQDGVMPDVAGMDEFDIDDFGTSLENGAKLLALGAPSDTLRKQVFKRLAFQYLADARQEVRNRVAQEIDSGTKAGS